MMKRMDVSEGGNQYYRKQSEDHEKLSKDYWSKIVHKQKSLQICAVLFKLATPRSSNSVPVLLLQAKRKKMISGKDSGYWEGIFLRQGDDKLWP